MLYHDYTHNFTTLLQRELLLAFWASIGFKPGDFITRYEGEANCVP
jgi:hypothetical protein